MFDDQKEFAELELRNEILSVLKGVRFAIDEIVFNIKAECIYCLEAKRKARNHQIRYRAELMANSKTILEK